MMVFITHCTDCGESLEVEDEESDQFVTPYDEYTGEYGKPTSTHVCEPCKTKRARVSLQRLRNQTLRDAAPVPQNDPNWDDFQPWEDEHGLTDEEREALAQNLAYTPDFQEEHKGEPMEIAWQLLKAAFFTPKSGYEDEKDYPKRAVIPPTWSKEHFWNRVGVAGSGDRETKFREAQHGFPLKRYPRWPHSEGKEGVKDAGERPIDTKTMFDFIGGAEREGETYQERIQRIRDFTDKAKFRTIEHPPNVENATRQDMRPGWKFGAGGRKEETAVGDEAWDKIRLPTGMEDIQEGHEGSDDWWETGVPIDWRGEGEA
jgi:hypothetical protein